MVGTLRSTDDWPSCAPRLLAGHRPRRLLVRRGVPFREAHEVVGHLVVWCQVHDCELADVSDDDLAVSPHLTPDVREVLTVPGRSRRGSSRGGTALARVAEQLSRAARRHG